ncbi:MAG: amidohydrolase family protein [Nitrospinota bacterium]|jgi:aminocarboxymuconate-semialdehyde decarboxylase|nr:amidohydrolase family protein [Nitrospinota bacterium]MDP6483611.1 amidohydrolase family protein [Nitrospinota bacterium]
MIIDVHAHAISGELADEMTRGPWLGLHLEKLPDGGFAHPITGLLPPLFFDLEGRLGSLEERGVGLQLISPPISIFTDQGLAGGVEQARRLNECTAKLVEESGGRLGGLAIPSLSDPPRIPDELRRAVETHGFRGAALPTTAAGRFLDGPDFEPMFAALETLGLFTFLHPYPNLLHKSLEDYSLVTLVGFPTETTIAVSRLIYAGVLERHPGLKLVLAHGGGTLAFLNGRLNLGYFAPKHEFNPDCQKYIPKPPGEYIKQLYFDSLVSSGESLRFLVDLVGADRVMFGTDFPFEVGDPEGRATLPAIQQMPEADREKILSGNAAALLAGAGDRNSH